MSDELKARIKAWLRKVESDLRLAKIATTSEDPPLDAAIYHCQQAGEKSVKAFLQYHDVPIERTHDVTRLAKQASTLNPTFTGMLDDTELLSPLVTQFRYPDEADWEAAPLPTREKFDTALAAAQRIYDFVLSLLPSETHPT